MDVVKAADWVVDLGPGSADEGGQLVYEGSPSGVSGSNSLLSNFI